MIEHGDRSVLVDGARIRYRRVGPRGAPRVVLIHGGHAHRGWWIEVVPELAQRFEVLLLDLSGHGDSDHRPEYSPELWAREVAAVIRSDGGRPVSVVGHSMGGLVAIYAAADHPDLVERLVIVDTRLRWPGCDGSKPRGAPWRAKPVYRSLDDVLARFRLRPAGTVADPALLARVARQSVVETSEGWTWKFDPDTAQRFTDVGVHERLRRVEAPVGFVYGERSPMADSQTVAYLDAVCGPTVARRSIPGAYHHVSLDDPQACTQAIEQMLEQLARSDEPQERPA